LIRDKAGLGQVAPSPLEFPNLPLGQCWLRVLGWQAVLFADGYAILPVTRTIADRFMVFDIKLSVRLANGVA